jgi:prolyl-tRNA synthetase
MSGERAPSVRSIASVKGMRDLLPPKTAVWAAVEATARRIFGRYGYGEIRTPILEETELFVRSVGEATDIVGKEMFSFPDKKGKSLTLRPENEALDRLAREQREESARGAPAAQGEQEISRLARDDKETV